MLKGRITAPSYPLPSGVRLLLPSDLPFLRSWFLAPGTLDWFPMQTPEELEIDLKIWTQYAQVGSALVLEDDTGRPQAAGVLYLQANCRQRHWSLFAILVDHERRGEGLGSRMMDVLMTYAKERFGIELLRLEVYSGNPAERLYRRLGFIESGREADFIRNNGQPVEKIEMYKWL